MPGSWSVDICDESIVLRSSRLVVVSLEIMNGEIVAVDCLARCMFVPQSVMAIMCLLGELYWVPILLIKLSLGVLILILFVITHNRHSYPFSLPRSRFLWNSSSYDLFSWQIRV